MAGPQASAVDPHELDRMRALAVRPAEIAALPVMAERKRAWQAISGPQPHRDRAEADLERTYRTARADDCAVELPLRDVYDIDGPGQRTPTAPPGSHRGRVGS